LWRWDAVAGRRFLQQVQNTFPDQEQWISTCCRWFTPSPSRDETTMGTDRMLSVVATIDTDRDGEVLERQLAEQMLFGGYLERIFVERSGIVDLALGRWDRYVGRHNISSILCIAPSLRTSPTPTVMMRFKYAYLSVEVSNLGSVRK
jgi:hypothetical protein